MCDTAPGFAGTPKGRPTSEACPWPSPCGSVRGEAIVAEAEQKPEHSSAEEEEEEKSCSDCGLGFRVPRVLGFGFWVQGSGLGFRV